jgi:hypothetical protein
MPSEFVLSSLTFLSSFLQFCILACACVYGCACEHFYVYDCSSRNAVAVELKIGLS